MKTIQPFQSNKPSPYPMIIIVMSLFIAFVFTYDLFTSYQAKNDEYATALSDQSKAGKLLEELDAVKVDSQKNSSELKKYIQEFREDVIYDKVFSTVGTDGKI